MYFTKIEKVLDTMYFTKIKLYPGSARALARLLLRSLKEGRSEGGVEHTILDQLLLAGVITEAERRGEQEAAA